MEPTCNVIRDLLPLYAEDIASSDSRILVENHILSCLDCKRELEGMKLPEKFPPDVETALLSNLKKKLRTRKILTVVLTVFVTMLVAVIGIAYLSAPNYLPYSDSLVSISENEAGMVLAAFGEEVSGYDLNMYQNENGSGYSYSLTTWNTLWSQYFQPGSVKTAILNPENEDIVAVYYYMTDGSEDLLIYGDDLNQGGGTITLPRLFLAYYLLIAAALVVIFGFFWLVFRKNALLRNITEKATLLPLSYIIGHILIKGFSTTSYSASRDFFAILLATVPIYVIIILAVDYFRQAKQKRSGN